MDLNIWLCAIAYRPGGFGFDFALGGASLSPRPGR